MSKSSPSILIVLSTLSGCVGRTTAEVATDSDSRGTASDSTQATTGTTSLETTATSVADASTTGGEGSSSTGPGWTGDCALLYEGLDLPIVAEIGDWPTDGGDLSLQATCTMTAAVVNDEWVADLSCVDPIDALERPLQLRVRVPEGVTLATTTDEPVELELLYDQYFDPPVAIVVWYRIQSSGVTLSAAMDASALHSASSWTELASSVLPEIDVRPVDLGCIPPPDDIDHDWRAVGFEFSGDAGSETLVASETAVMGPHVIHLVGAADICSTGDIQCQRPQFYVLPAG